MTKKLSVIVTAHNRKEYIPYAINSILSASNTETVEDIEIIVVKNFEDDKLDSWLEQNNIKNIITNEESLALKQAIGINNASGDLIAFLEDDDMFALNKVQVLRSLSYHQNLDFFHNSFISIREYITSSRIVPFNESNIEFFHADNLQDKRILKYIIKKYHPELYNSCIAISKDLATKCLDGLKRVDINTERFWLLCAIEKGRQLALTNAPLTLYRVHSQSFSQPNSAFFNAKLLERYVRSYLFMLQYFQKEIVRQVIKEQYVLHLAHYFIITKYNTAKKLRLTMSLFANSLRPSAIYNEYSLLSAIALLSSLASVSLAKRILYR